jgi:hypothetical protein
MAWFRGPFVNLVAACSLDQQPGAPLAISESVFLCYGRVFRLLSASFKTVFRRATARWCAPTMLSVLVGTAWSFPQMDKYHHEMPDGSLIVHEDHGAFLGSRS